MDSVAIQTQALRETQAVAIADQQALDEESLQRIKEEDSKAKVPCPAYYQSSVAFPSLPAVLNTLMQKLMFVPRMRRGPTAPQS